MKKIYKVGIVGYGYMGEIRRRVVEKNQRLELVGIADISEAVRKKITNCRTYESFEKLLKEDTDMIFVCTPNCYSPEICIESMKRGKHVFCEKPAGPTLEELKNIIKAENNGVKLMFGFNHRFHPAVMEVKMIVENGQLGSIIAMRGVYGKPVENFVNSWRNNKRISGGGILLDQGIHMLDLFCYFCGDFEFVKCFTSNSFWKFDVEDNAYVMMQNKKGQLASLHSSSILWKHMFRLDIILEKGYLIMEGLLSKSGRYGPERLIIGNGTEKIIYFDQDLSWELEVGEFIKCIDEDREVSCGSSQDALRVMEIIEKAYRDARS